MVRWWLAALGLGSGLACAGVGSGPEPARSWSGPPLVAFQRTDAGACTWTRWSPGASPEEVGRSSDCPTQVVFKPDGSKVAYTAGGAAHVGAWPGLRDTVSIPLPAFPAGVMDWQPLWVTSDGVLRLQGVATPTQTRKGDEIVLTAGDLTTSVWQEGDQLPKWEVEGDRTVPPKPDTQTAMIPWGTLAIDARYEANRKGKGWTLLSALPTSVAADMPFTPTVDPDAWPSLASTYTSCRDGSCDKSDWDGREELKAVLGDAGVGFLASGGGGWLFGLRMGDTPHAVAPVLWCDDADCESPRPLADLPEANSFAVQPRGDHVLVGEEYTLARARVYRAGQTEPVLVLADAEGAGWIPDP